MADVQNDKIQAVTYVSVGAYQKCHNTNNKRYRRITLARYKEYHVAKNYGTNPSHYYLKFRWNFALLQNPK